MDVCAHAQLALEAIPPTIKMECAIKPPPPKNCQAATLVRSERHTSSPTRDAENCRIPIVRLVTTDRPRHKWLRLKPRVSAVEIRMRAGRTSSLSGRRGSAAQFGPATGCEREARDEPPFLPTRSLRRDARGPSARW